MKFGIEILNTLMTHDFCNSKGT